MSFLRRTFAILAIVLLCLLALRVGFHARADSFLDQTFDDTPKDYIVNSTEDTPDAVVDGVCETSNPGECTLRAAIQELNANNNVLSAVPSITFNIPGDDVKTITFAQELPQITKPVVINGFTQPGSSPNTASAPAALNSVIKVEINASQLGQNKSGIVFAQGAGGSVLRGVSVYGADSTDQEHANVMINEVQVIVYGCYIGVKASGQEAASKPRSAGIMTDKDLIASNGNIVLGGNRADQRNILNGTTDNPDIPLGGIVVGANGKNIKVYGNIIGLGRDGLTDLGGSYGVVLKGESNIVGGPSIRRNVISGNTYAQVWTKSKNVIATNYIGTDAAAEVQTSISNGPGIKVYGSGNLVGSTTVENGNVIKGVSGAGVVVATKRVDGQVYDAAQTNTIIGNIITAVSPGVLSPGSAQSNLPIDIITEDRAGDQTTLGLVGLNGQNPTAAFGTPNNLLNAPVIKAASQTSSQVKITYDLNVPDIRAQQARYRVEFYLTTATNSANAGPAEQFLDAVTVDSGQNQTATLTLAQGVNTAYRAITATVTTFAPGPAGIGSTSEFASNQIVGSFVDTDGDGISDTEEDAGPNGGDANADGVADKSQATVTSFVSQASQKNIYMTFVTSGCANNARADDVDARTLNKPDTAYGYPYGLIDFALRCTQGATAHVTSYVYVDDDPSKYSLRKYNYQSQLFSTLASGSITKATLGGQTVLKTEYDITDGGPLDEDGEANGVILDPIGLAIAGYQYDLPQVGVALVYILTPLLLALLTIIVYAYFDYLRHKRPLVEENPHIHYTFWHHLKVVTFPILRYRISFVIERQDVR